MRLTKSKGIFRKIILFAIRYVYATQIYLMLSVCKTPFNTTKNHVEIRTTWYVKKLRNPFATNSLMENLLS